MSEDLGWSAASGRGHLFGWTEIHAPQSATYHDPSLTSFRLVKLAEGPLLISRMADVEWDQLHYELPLEVGFDDVSVEMTLLRFRPSA